MELSVIICDDLAEERSQLCRFVQAYGQERGYRLRMEEAAGGEELLSRWRRDRWDMVLLDIYMPEMLGTAAAKELRDMGSAGRIIFLTSFLFK